MVLLLICIIINSIQNFLNTLHAPLLNVCIGCAMCTINSIFLISFVFWDPVYQFRTDVNFCFISAPRQAKIPIYNLNTSKPSVLNSLLLLYAPCVSKLLSNCKISLFQIYCPLLPFYLMRSATLVHDLLGTIVERTIAYYVLNRIFIVTTLDSSNMLLFVPISTVLK